MPLVEAVARFLLELTPASASAAGLLMGVSAACLWLLVLHCRSSHVTRSKAEVVPMLRLSRQARAAQILEEVSNSRSFTGAAEAASSPSHQPSHLEREAAGGGEDGWETEGEEDEESAASGNASDSDSSEEEELSDRERSTYERMEAARLKMVFVVHQLSPKIPPNAVAELTAGAGVGLVEWLNALPRRADGAGTRRPSSPEWASHDCLVEPELSEADRWRTWYAWWNRIGCAKIALKCSEESVAASVVVAAVVQRIPVYVMRKCHVLARPAGMATAGDDGASGKEIVVVAVGPAPADVLDPITGKLKLFN